MAVEVDATEIFSESIEEPLCAVEVGDAEIIAGIETKICSGVTSSLLLGLESSRGESMTEN